jgi:hypothetical protein
MSQMRDAQLGGLEHEDGGMCRKLFVSEFRLLPLGSGAEDAVFNGRQFDKSVILLCVRWYLAYNLSLRNLEEMMAERGISVDHATVHCWVVRYSSELLERFNRRKRAVTSKWHINETYIKARGRWMCVDAPLNARKIITRDLGTAIGW